MTPPFLQSNDQIRILSPSGSVDPIYIDGAKKVLENWGYSVSESKYAREKYGRFAGTSEQRLEDLQNALDDVNVKAILCSRGGYGLAQVIDKIDFTGFKKYPKWIIGFSDITVLHSAVFHTGISSVHSIMAKNITELSENAEAVKDLKAILSGYLPVYSFSSHPLNITGTAKGKLIGGNLSVIAGIRGTRFDFNYKGNILFIEDVGEEPYKIDRMMHNLRLGGILSQISGLIVGQFSDMEEDHLMNGTVYENIRKIVSEYGIPVCFDFPAGHVDNNLPLIIGEKAQLNITAEKIVLSYL